MYAIHHAYPTIQHERAAARIVDIFSREPDIQAILLTCSCARGKASRDSCLDIAVLLTPEALKEKGPSLEQAWDAANRADPAFQALRTVGTYSQVDLEFVHGRFEPGNHNWTSGPDDFELAIGNVLAYSVPLWEQGDYLRRLKNQWLPYYGEPLRRERLEMVRRFGMNNLHHIPGYLARGLHFQAFHRLWHAYGEFLQGLFISRGVYPIAYDKWVREEVEEILGLPQLYGKLAELFEINHFESGEIGKKAKRVEDLWAEYIPEPAAS
jgi:predicted nucleotidyltransferase